MVNNLRFPGQYFDAETGLHYNMSRDYNSLTGRYITSDPLGLAGGVSTFAYVGNNPLNGVDPNGQLAFFWHFGITLAATDSLSTAWNAMVVDFALGSQGTNREVTQQHAMAGFDSTLNRYQTREEAIAATNTFIQTNISGNLAGAIHAGQDLSTPRHAGEEWHGFGWNLETAAHIFGDVFPSWRTITQAYQNTEQIVGGNWVSGGCKK